MQTARRSLTPRMLETSLQSRLHGKVDAATYEALRCHLVGLLHERTFPTYRGSVIDVAAMSDNTGIEPETLKRIRPDFQPICDAISRAAADAPIPRKKAASLPRRRNQDWHKPSLGGLERRGKDGGPISAAPLPLWTVWAEPESFAAALRLHMARHRDSLRRLHSALAASNSAPSLNTLAYWYRGVSKPSTDASHATLGAIERRYALPSGYFSAKLPRREEKTTSSAVVHIPHEERRRLAWHLPADFARRPPAEQEEILNWVREVIISGSTEYRRYQSAAAKQRYALRFKGLALEPTAGRHARIDTTRDSALIDAPPQLLHEMSELVRFKTSTLTAVGLRRNGVWNAETASQKVEHFALMFGALGSDPHGDIAGRGVPLEAMTLAMLIFPAVWDWYLGWRERKRGFFTMWEVDMLTILLSLVKTETGWLRQIPVISNNLAPIPGLISAADIDAAQADWDAVCENMHKHARNRIKEISRVVRVHRDPFEPILAILEAPSPVAEYRKITEEILRLMPNENLYPRAAAEAVRSFLLLRLGLHLGLRQRNLRELLVCPRGRMPLSERRLEELKRGELRWSAKEDGWEVLIPAVAFKNASSSFFGSKPFRLVLPDLGGLYEMIDAWIDRHRERLIGPAEDPGTFFVKTVKITSGGAAYNQTTFYEAWRLTIQRYGIYNPYTGRGAIEGLLPHGPHNVRDVLATHILKQTGSYEQASYAIQDTPAMIASHYGRFLPQDKSAIAAKILNRVWSDV